MRCPDCGLAGMDPSRGCGRCGGEALPLVGALRSWKRGWRGGAPPPRVIASGKTCPKCGEVTYLSRAVCGGCGHTYRTIFPNSLAPPDAGMSPGLPSPEVSALKAKGVFLGAWVLMTALAAGLIFYLVNHY